jgi:carbamoyltransferase
MKFLGLRLCEHDSNMSYFDGNEVFYFKLERKTKIKHDAYDNFETWIKEINKIWNVKIEDLNEIGIVFDPWRYKLDSKNDNFFPSKKFNYLPYNITRINHHYAHALSSWPVVKNCKAHFVFDTFGDYNIAWTVFKNDKIADVFYCDKFGSLGSLLNSASTFMDVKAHHALDLVGKLMGLQSYGKINKEYLKKLHNFSIDNLGIVFDFSLWEQHIGDTLLANLKKLDWISTVHFYVGELLIMYFKKYVDHIDDQISFSGGCAQNVVWNTQIKNVFKNLNVFPHCGDEGLSLGVLEFFRKKHNLPFFKNKNFPYWQI